MASEIRVDKINSLSGVGTVTLSPTGVDIAGITTAATLRSTTGIVTSLTVGSLTSLGDVDIADKIIHTGDTNTAIRFPAADTITAETGGSERLRILPTGSVGIGTTNPLSRLQLAGRLSVHHSIVDTEGEFLRIGRTDIPTIRYHSIKAKHGGAAANNYIALHLHNASDTTSQTEILRLIGDGDVGIGTITPQNNARLQVSTNQQVVAAFEGTGGSDPQIYLGDDMTTPTDNCIILGYDKADNRGYLTVGGDGDNVFTVKNGGDIEIGVGNLKFGTSGKGIDFSATGDAGGMTSELLDDYEEGSFTPTYINLDVPSHATTNYATYTKIGRLVTIRLSVSISSSVNDNSGVGFGLPFAPSSNQRIVLPAISDRSGTNKSPFAMVNVNQDSNVYVKLLEGYGFQAYSLFSGNYILVTGTYESA